MPFTLGAFPQRGKASSGQLRYPHSHLALLWVPVLCLFLLFIWFIMYVSWRSQAQQACYVCMYMLWHGMHLGDSLDSRMSSRASPKDSSHVCRSTLAGLIR